MILEFSHVQNPILRQLYDTYSFNVIPRIGGIVANDSESYQYLVESIRRFPTQVFFNFFIFFYISFTIFSFIYLHNLSSFLPSFCQLLSSANFLAPFNCFLPHLYYSILPFFPPKFLSLSPSYFEILTLVSYFLSLI